MNIKRCPGCGQSNQCQANSARPQDCWCMALPLSAEAKALLPQSNQCLCHTCLAALQQQTSNQRDAAT